MRYASEIVPYVHQLRESVFMYDSLADVLNRRLPRGSDVLSLGAGTCSLEWRLAERGHFVIAVDSDAASVSFAEDLCTQRGVRVRLERQDMFAAPPEGRFDAVLALYSELSLSNLRELAVKVQTVTEDGAIFVSNLPFSPPETLGRVTSFVDILGGVDNVAACLSEYRRGESALVGNEAYLLAGKGGAALLFRDFTHLPLDCQSLAELRAEAETWRTAGWSLEELFSLSEYCPSAAPPFCDQAFLLWRRSAE